MTRLCFARPGGENRNVYQGETGRPKAGIRRRCAGGIGLYVTKITLHTILDVKMAVGQRLTEIDLGHGATVDDSLTYISERWGDKLSDRLLDPDSVAVLP